MLAEGSVECRWASCQTYNNAPVWGMLLAAGFGVEPLRAPNVIGAMVSLPAVRLVLGGALKGWTKPRRRRAGPDRCRELWGL